MMLYVCLFRYLFKYIKPLKGMCQYKVSPQLAATRRNLSDMEATTAYVRFNSVTSDLFKCALFKMRVSIKTQRHLTIS